jgi:hypothetical protein
MLNPIGLSMHELGQIMTSPPAAANQGIYLAHDLNSNHYFVLDRLNNSDLSQQPFEFETFDDAYAFSKLRERGNMDKEKKQEKKVSPTEIERFAVSRKAQQLLKDGTQTIDAMEKLVDRVSPVVDYGRVNSLLLTQASPEQGFMTKQAWIRHDKKEDLKGVDFDQLEGVKVFVPNAKQPGQPVTFDVGKMYSADEIAAKYPNVKMPAQALVSQRNLMHQSSEPERLGAVVDALRELRVPKPDWVWGRNQIHAVQTHMARHMAFASTGLTNQSFHFSASERKAMANLQPDELQTMFVKSVSLASKINRTASRKLYQMKTQQKMQQPVKTKAKER